MANSKTDHSMELRRETAREWNKKLDASKNKFEIRSKDADAIAAIKSGLKDIPGKTNTEKLLNLINFYKANQQ